MAKSDSVISLQGTFGEITFVKSRTYRNHVRMRRGTYKKAVVNAAFKASSKKLIAANIPAKIINDAVKQYRSGLEGGSLWSDLRSTFRKQLKEDGAVNFSKMDPFEIHTKYTFDRFLSLQPEIAVDKKRSILKVRIEYNRHPTFRKASYIDGYQLTVVGIFPDLKKKSARTAEAQSEIRPLKGKVDAFDAQLTIPPKAKSFLVCVKMEGYMKGKVPASGVTKGMRVFEAGEIGK